MAAAKIIALRLSSTLATLLIAAELLMPAAMAYTAAQPASTATIPTAAAATGVVPPPSVEYSPASAEPTDTVPATLAAAAALPSSSSPETATPAASSSGTAAATAPKKFPAVPNQGGGPYLPAAEVASALPVPTPEELPSGASLGFGGNGGGGPWFGGPGDVCCGGGGYGWFGGPGGYGPGTYGYNGPLYWGAAPAGGLGSVAAANLLVPLLVACVFAAILA